MAQRLLDSPFSSSQAEEKQVGLSVQQWLKNYPKNILGNINYELTKTMQISFSKKQDVEVMVSA